MFKRKRSPAKTAMNIILVVILLGAVAFLGYSVGKPIMEFLDSRENERPSYSESHDFEENSPVVTKAVTTAPEETEPPVTTVLPEAEPETGKRILTVTIPTGAGSEDYIRSRAEYAKVNGYYGISLELLAVGGSVKYQTANERAISSNAVSAGAIADLKTAADIISGEGLVPYARVSALSDHIVSWDKSICYLFENSTSTWLDNDIDSGGKPWMSVFSETAREYICSIVKEISDAGFSGIIAGELEFPPFRNSDLNYVGASVKSADRYKGLQDFSNAMQDSFGTAKTYAVEVDAQDIVSGRAEILSNPDSLDARIVYVKYDSSAVGLRIVKTDETEISYSGLSEEDKLTVVMKSVADELLASGKTVIPAVTDEALVPQLVAMGYDEQMILIY